MSTSTLAHPAHNVIKCTTSHREVLTVSAPARPACSQACGQVNISLATEPPSLKITPLRGDTGGASAPHPPENPKQEVLVFLQRVHRCLHAPSLPEAISSPFALGNLAPGDALWQGPPPVRHGEAPQPGVGASKMPGKGSSKGKTPSLHAMPGVCPAPVERPCRHRVSRGELAVDCRFPGRGNAGQWSEGCPVPVVGPRTARPQP